MTILDDVGDADLIVPERVHPMIYALISNKLATLRELRDDYTFEEALDLYEICAVNCYNKLSITKTYQKS